MVGDILRPANSYFAPGELLPRAPLESLITEAIWASDDNYGIAAAIAWANNYTFLHEVLQSNINCFCAACLNFQTMARQRFEDLSYDRLSDERIAGVRADNPERLLLSDLVEGMWVPLPPNFSPNGKDTTTSLRSTYLRVH